MPILAFMQIPACLEYYNMYSNKVNKYVDILAIIHKNNRF